MWGETKTGEQRDTQNSETCCGVEALLLSRGGRRGCCRHPGRGKQRGGGLTKARVGGHSSGPVLREVKGYRERQTWHQTYTISLWK